MGVVASYQLRRADRRMAKTLVFVKCAFAGDVAKLQEMMAKDKVSPNAQDRFGMTAVHWAAFGGKLLCIQELLKAGASTHIVDWNGRNALHHACRKDHDQVVRYLVSDVKMDVNALSESKDTPLHKAVTGKSIRSIEALLQLGADPTLRNDQNRTPLEELDANPSIVHDTFPEPIPTARMQEELGHWRREFITEVQSSRSRRLSVEALVSPELKHFSHVAAAAIPAARDLNGSSRKYASRSNTSVREVENTLVTSFRSNISEVSGRRSSGSELSSTCQLSARASARQWAKPSAPNVSASPESPGKSGDSSKKRDSGNATVVPLNLQGLTTPTPPTPSTETAPVHSFSSVRSRSDATHMTKARRSRNLRDAGKRVIMALRVKKCLSTHEKREMIRLLLVRHMKTDGGSDAVEQIGNERSLPEERMDTQMAKQGSNKFNRSPSDFLSMPPTSAPLC